jgi:nicotinate-nucleotide--dimethylbenzimidazole phosphoribosyltransferase
MINSALDAVLVDVEAMLVDRAEPGIASDAPLARVRLQVERDLAALAAQLPVAAVNLRSGTILATIEQLGLDDPQRVLLIGERDTGEEAATAAGVAYAGITSDGLVAAVEGWVAAQAGRAFAAAADLVTAPDANASRAADELQDRLTKPRGALGRLEALGSRLAGMAHTCPPPLPVPATVTVFAADHGVLAEGVSPWPQEVTAQMVLNFCSGGAAVNVLARQHGASVLVVDVGVAAPLPPQPGLLRRSVALGTANLATGPAMSELEATLALDVGTQVATRAVAAGARCLVAGDMGIGNTTPSAALIAAFTGSPSAAVTGRGTGIDDATLDRKVEIVAQAAERVRRRPPLEVLAEIGGLEIAAIAGFIVGGAAARMPVVLDGVIAVAGAMVAEALVPGATAWCVAGHRSVEPGATVALTHLGLEPLLDLGLRLGEGTGAVLALSLLESAARILGEMATFDGAGVAQKS